MLRELFIHLQCRFLIPLPALCGLHDRRTSLALSLNSSLVLPASVPGEDPLLLLSFYLESEASGEQALSLPLSITLNNCDVHSTLRPLHSLSAFLSLYLRSVPPGPPLARRLSF